MKDAKLFSSICTKPNELSEDAICMNIKKCLQDGANINAQDKNDQDNTILHTAVTNNYQQIVRFLLEEGAKINIPNSVGKSPLDLAQDQQNQNLIKILT